MPPSLPLSHTLRGHLRKTAQIWRNALALSPVIYVWHLGRVCSMTWHKYLYVKFFLAQVMPSTSVCHSLPSPSLSLLIFAYACLLPSFRLKKVIYFTLTLTSTLFTPSTFCPPFSAPSPSHYHYQLLRLPWRHRKLMMILIDAFALLWPCFTFSLHVFLRI